MMRKLINKIFRRKEPLPMTQEMIDAWEESMRIHRQRVRDHLKEIEEMMKNEEREIEPYDNKEFIDKLGKREERIRALDTAALIEEFKDKHSGNVALIRQELQDRYKSGRDRDAIALAFSNSIVSDQQWVKNQEKKR